MNSVKDDFLVDDFDVEVQVVECLGHGFQLTYGVMDEPTSLAPVMELKTLCSFIVTKVGGGFDPKMLRLLKRQLIDCDYI